MSKVAMVLVCLGVLGALGCSRRSDVVQSPEVPGGVLVKGWWGEYEVRKVEVEGDDYILATGYRACAICPAKDSQ